MRRDRSRWLGVALVTALLLSPSGWAQAMPQPPSDVPTSEDQRETIPEEALEPGVVEGAGPPTVDELTALEEADPALAPPTTGVTEVLPGLEPALLTEDQAAELPDLCPEGQAECVLVKEVTDPAAIAETTEMLMQRTGARSGLVSDCYSDYQGTENRSQACETVDYQVVRAAANPLNSYTATVRTSQRLKASRFSNPPRMMVETKSTLSLSQ